MVDQKIVKEWLSKSEDDLGFASKALDEDIEYFAQICFHFHQAAEKSLKAFIVAKELEFRKIHDLVALLNLCLEKDSSLKSLQEPCQFLNAFYIDTRYPTYWPSGYSKNDAQQAQSCASEIHNTITAKVREKP